jgi:hypothetical protein
MGNPRAYRIAPAATNQCGKVTWVDRSAAKEEARRLRGLGDRVRPYRCPRCALFHVGHLPQATIAGLLTAHQVYSGARLSTEE